MNLVQGKKLDVQVLNDKSHFSCKKKKLVFFFILNLPNKINEKKHLNILSTPLI